MERHINSEMVAVDGASSMLELAKSRLREFSHRVEWVVSDFRALPTKLLEPDTFDVVISSYALHHLNAQEKLAVLKSVVRAIRPGGWILNADLVIADAPDIERRIQKAEEQSDREVPLVDQPAGIPSDFAEHAKLMFDLLALAYQKSGNLYFQTKLLSVLNR